MYFDYNLNTSVVDNLVYHVEFDIGSTSSINST